MLMTPVMSAAPWVCPGKAGAGTPTGKFGMPVTFTVAIKGCSLSVDTPASLTAIIHCTHAQSQRQTDICSEPCSQCCCTAFQEDHGTYMCAHVHISSHVYMPTHRHASNCIGHGQTCKSYNCRTTVINSYNNSSQGTNVQGLCLVIQAYLL